MDVYAGIDVSKARLDVAARPAGKIWTAANDQAGIDALVARLEGLHPSLVVLDATGGYERAAVAALGAAGLPVAVVNPRQARAFARATGKLAKTYSLDARVLAHFAETIRPEVRPLRDDEAREFAQILARRRQVVGMLVAERNRLETSVSPVRERVEAHIGFLEMELSELDDDLDRAIRESPLWREKDELLRSVPGIGPRVSATLLAEMPELGSLTDKKLAALVGVAPLNRAGGDHRGKGRVSRGRSRVRAMLYMAAVTAARCNPVFREFYGRLPAAGMPRKVALTACMRKLLVVLNGMLRHGTRWGQPTPVAARHRAAPGGFRANESGPTPIEGRRAVESRDVTIPLRVEHDLPYIYLSVRGPAGALRRVPLLFDTGGGALLLSEALALDLDIRPTGESAVEEWGMSFEPIPPPPVDAAGVALDLEGPAFVVRGSGAAGSGPGEVVAGRTLSRYRIALDFPRREFALSVPGSGAPRGASVPTPVHPGTRFPRVEIEVAGERYGMLLDTGAGCTMVSPGLFDRWAREFPEWPRATGALGTANKGRRDLDLGGRMVRIPRLAIGPFELAGVCAVARRAGGRFEGASPEMVTGPIVGALGCNALKLFRAEVDYASGTTYLEQRVQPDPGDMDLVGLSVYRRGDGT